MSLASLNSSGIQQSNPALYQTIKDLYDQNLALTNLIASYGFTFNKDNNQLTEANPLILSDTLSVGQLLTLVRGQIQFPAIQNSSVGANVLDDYEEGTWTPVDGSGAGLVFGIPTGPNTCRYTKIGRLVTFSGNVTYPATANGLGAYIGGLPFGVNSVMDGTAFYRFPIAAGVIPLGFIRINNTVIQLYNPATAAQYTNAGLSTTTHYFSGFYETN